MVPIKRSSMSDAFQDTKRSHETTGASRASRIDQQIDGRLSGAVFAEVGSGSADGDDDFRWTLAISKKRENNEYKCWIQIRIIERSLR